jgi:hypothetical protein
MGRSPGYRLDKGETGVSLSAACPTQAQKQGLNGAPNVRYWITGCRPALLHLEQRCAAGVQDDRVVG